MALGGYLLDGDNYQIRFLSHPYSTSNSYDNVYVYIDDIMILEGSDQIDFGDVYTFGTGETSLFLSNPGTDTLRVTDISFDNVVFSADFSSIDIPMGDMASISVFATPTLVGLDSSIVTITSNAGTESIMAYVNGVSHPMLMFDPVAIFDTLLVGDSANYNITISNPGDDTLTFDAGDFYGDLAGSFTDDFENGLGQWGYTGTAMQLSSAGEGYNSDYSMVAGVDYEATYYQEMIESYEMQDIENATLELWGKCSSGSDWLYLYVDHGNGWEGNYNIFMINNSSWTNYSYDLTSFLNDRGVVEGDDVRFKLKIWGNSSNIRYFDDISITGIGGVSEAVLDSNYTHILAPGESTDINISYVVPAVSGGEIVGGLEFTSNDPANESAQYPISLFVNGPDLSTISSLEFSDIVLGTDEVQDFPIYNVGTLDLVIDSLTLSNTDYELQNLPVFPVTLPPGDSTVISVRYPAYDVYDHLTDLSIYSNDLGKPGFRASQLFRHYSSGVIRRLGYQGADYFENRNCLVLI